MLVVFPLWDTPVHQGSGHHAVGESGCGCDLCHCSSQRSRLWGWFTDIGWDELGDCGDSVFFFWVLGNDDVGIWGVSSRLASKFELGVWDFVFVWCSVKGSPLASVLGSFFVKYAKSVSGGCGSFNYKSVLLGMSAPPL